jgi:magnesium-transporting ATPase (P-type)
MNPEKIENNLTFLGIFGMIDPLKDGVVKSIETC